MCKTAPPCSETRFGDTLGHVHRHRAFESLQPRAQDVRTRADAMKLARELSRISELEVLVAPKGSSHPTCIYRRGELITCLCPDTSATAP